MRQVEELNKSIRKLDVMLDSLNGVLSELKTPDPNEMDYNKLAEYMAAQMDAYKLLPWIVQAGQAREVLVKALARAEELEAIQKSFE